MTDAVKIGLRIKQCREEKGWSQAELGSVLGLNKSTIQRYETGKVARIKLPVLESIAYELDVNPEYLALETDDPIDYDDPEYVSDAPIEVTDYFENDMQKVAEFQEAVDEDRGREYYINGEMHHNIPATWEEESLVEKYKKIDAYGRKAVRDLLNTEYERCTSLRTKEEN